MTTLEDLDQDLEIQLATAIDVYEHLVNVFTVDVLKIDSEKELYRTQGQQALLNHLRVKLNITKD